MGPCSGPSAPDKRRACVWSVFRNRKSFKISFPSLYYRRECVNRKVSQVPVSWQLCGLGRLGVPRTFIPVSCGIYHWVPFWVLFCGNLLLNLHNGSAFSDFLPLHWGPAARGENSLHTGNWRKLKSSKAYWDGNDIPSIQVSAFRICEAKKQCHSFNIYREHIMYSGTGHGLEGRQKCKTQPSLEDACQEGHGNCDRP